VRWPSLVRAPRINDGQGLATAVEQRGEPRLGERGARCDRWARGTKARGGLAETPQELVPCRDLSVRSIPVPQTQQVVAECANAAASPMIPPARRSTSSPEPVPDLLPTCDRSRCCLTLQRRIGLTVRPHPCTDGPDRVLGNRMGGRVGQPRVERESSAAGVAANRRQAGLRPVQCAEGT